MKKNLVYFICNNLYKELLVLSLDFLYVNINRETTDVLVIAANDLKFAKGETAPDHIFYVDPFDFKYHAKYDFTKWKHVHNYDNFLYMDADAIAIRNIDKAFSACYNRPHVLHCAMENNSIAKSDKNHKFSDFEYPDNIVAYNSGTFGFNKQLLPLFEEFHSYIEEHKEKAYHDQALFNEYFIQKGVVEPTYSLLIYFTIRNWKVPNTIDIEDSSIVHFFGGTFEGKPADSIEKFLKARLGVLRPQKQ